MTIDPKTTAVLVIDVLVTEGADTLYNPSEDEARVVENSVRVVDAARAAGLPIIFCDDAHIPGVDKELDLWGEHGICGRAVPNPALRAGSGERDFIIPKRRYSGFFGTDLDLTLRELGVRTLIAVGEDTNICVLHTLADAYFLGYETIVAEDATRTFLCGTQEAGIEHFVKCYDSTIATTDEVVAALEG
ncbi:MAG: isochorismatase family cysteine hydrolase [Coriobacteriales bacterium]|nr:isochorismatase family cysteine hydrolase [Coriobacteriales bacterium]